MKQQHTRYLAWIRLSRPLIWFISCFGASVGALNVTIADVAINQGLALNGIAFGIMLIGASLLSSGLMVHNDYTDFASDCVNRPHKPLPSGLISRSTANAAGLAMMIGSVIVSGLTTLPINGQWNRPCSILTLIIVCDGVLYNKYGKHWGLLGHTMVAFGVGAIPVWGAWAMRPQNLAPMLPLGIGILVMEIGREIMVCAGDMRGDVEAGFATTPIRIGRIPAMKLALWFYTAALPWFIIPVWGLLLFPPLFGTLYIYGALGFMAILYLTWILTYRVVNQGSEARIWNAFERYIRLGTRLGVVGFQIVLFLEAFL